MKVVILRGGSGAGKSTWIRKNFPSELTTIYSADNFFMEGDGKYNFDPSKLAEAHNRCLINFIKPITGANCAGIAIVDNTNTEIAEIAPFAEVALAFGHELQIITFAYDPVAAFKRNIHGTPLKVCMRQHQRLMHTTPLIPKRWPHDFTLWDETWPWGHESGDT